MLGLNKWKTPLYGKVDDLATLADTIHYRRFNMDRWRYQDASGLRDRDIPRLKAAGFDGYITLCSGGGVDRSQSTPVDLDRWREWVQGIVEFFGDAVSIWRIENEVAAKAYWSGSIDQYRQHYEVAYTAIKAVNEDATLIAGSLTGSHWLYAMDLFAKDRPEEAMAWLNRWQAGDLPNQPDYQFNNADVLRRALSHRKIAELRGYADWLVTLPTDVIFDIHIYNDACQAAELVRWFRGRLGPEKEVWITESSSAYRPPDNWGAIKWCVPYTIETLKAGADKVFYFPIVDHPQGVAHGTPGGGLLTIEGEKKPEWDAFAALRPLLYGDVT